MPYTAALRTGFREKTRSRLARPGAGYLKAAIATKPDGREQNNELVDELPNTCQVETMIMLYSSPIFAKASGSVGGLTFSHNRGGQYTRARVTPTDPSSIRQQFMRATIGVLAPYWGQTLSAAQRSAWNLYADNVTWINPIGETIFLTGQQHFLRINTVRLQIAQAILDAAPTIFDLGTFTAPTIVSMNSGPPATIDIAFDNTDAWANAVGGFMIFYAGRAQGPGRAFYRGPWVLSSSIEGDPVPPASPFTGSIGQIWPIGSIAWVQIRVIQIDGRMSLPVILGPTTIVA